MELSPGQRKAAFAVIVLVLAGLGFYLFVPTAHSVGRHAASGKSPSPGQTAAGPRPGQSPPTPTPAAAPSGTAGASGTSAPDIYQWLPFTEAGLGSAAGLVVRFGDAYGSFSYTESATRYVATMRSMVSPQLAGQISAAYATPGVASARISQRQVSAGSASILSLRDFGPTSLTFVLAVTENITSTKGGSRLSTDYAVTVSGGGTSWQVSDIELASAGNS